MEDNGSWKEGGRKKEVKFTVQRSCLLVSRSICFIRHNSPKLTSPSSYIEQERKVVKLKEDEKKRKSVGEHAIDLLA